MLFALVIGVSVAKIVANLCFYFGLFGASVLVIRGLLSADLGEFSIRLVPNEERRQP
jgi:energy-converting hydrogenase Eha subunit A